MLQTEPNTDTKSVANTDFVACPQCQQDMYRIRRKLHQRLFFGSQRFYCEFCQQAYLKWRKLVKEK